MKTYNIIEALNEPVGTEFEVEGNVANMIIKKSRINEIADKSLFWKKSDDQVEVDNYTTRIRLRKLRKKITFFEAMKLADEGKKVTNSFIDEDRFYYKKDGKLYYNHGYDIEKILAEELKSDWYEVED